jgi:hypothetical protein
VMLVAALGVVGGAGTAQPAPLVPLGVQVALCTAAAVLLLVVAALVKYVFFR